MIDIFQNTNRSERSDPYYTGKIEAEKLKVKLERSDLRILLTFASVKKCCQGSTNSIKLFKTIFSNAIL